MGSPYSSRTNRALRCLLGIRLGQLSVHAARPLRLPAVDSTPPRATGGTRISLVTPVLNQAEFIGQTIESVLAQNYPALEYMIMDGGSTDGTAEVIERYRSQLAWTESAPDGGQSAGINRGMRRATGEILAWINGDDLLLPGALHYVADFFERHPHVDVVYSHRVIIDTAGWEVGRWRLPAHSDRILSWIDFVPQETLFWRRHVWERIGAQVDETFQFAMDWDLLLRLRDGGAVFARLPRFLGAFRMHPKQKTLANMGEVGLAEMARLRQRSLGYVPTKAQLRLAIVPYVIQHMAFEQWSRVTRLSQRIVGLKIFDEAA